MIYKKCKKIALCLCLLMVAGLSLAAQIAAPLPANPPAGQVPNRLFGLTIDSVGDSEIVLRKLRELKDAAPRNPLPIVRIVLDMEKGVENVDPAYFNIIRDIRGSGLAYIMVELVDSTPDSSEKCIVKNSDKTINIEKSKEIYKNRTKAYFDYRQGNDFLRNYVDIWEIGNEINGEWFGNLPKERDAVAHRNLVLAMVSEAYKVFVDDQANTKKAKTAVTFYFNDDGDHHSYPMTKTGHEYSMRKWIDEGKTYFKNVDYVFISYYEDDNFDNFPVPNGSPERRPILPRFPKWAEIFAEIHDKYPVAKFGLGEFGPQCHYKIGSCDKVIDPKDYDDPEKPGDATPGTCPAESTREARKFQETSNGLWKRICTCCITNQGPYISRYYSTWDAEFSNAIKEKYGAALAGSFVGGYFYWHFNPDVLDKYTFSKNLKVPGPERNQRIREADETFRKIKEAYQGYIF